MPLPKECPSCAYLKPAGVHKLPIVRGFVPERQSAIEEKAGSLVQLNGRKKGKGETTPHSRQEVYSMLLWVQQERGYKPSYAKAKFMA
jgi:DNA repair protein RadD